jgi:hypothetical protein
MAYPCYAARYGGVTVRNSGAALAGQIGLKALKRIKKGVNNG